VNKDTVLRALGWEEDPRVGPFLRRVAEGKVGRELDRSRGRRSESEPGIRASAWLALARRGEDVRADAKGLLAAGAVEFAEDRAALEICLALLGDSGFIKAEHFKIESYTIGLAALEAIEKFEGREGMDVLVDAGMAHPWAAVSEEAVLVFQRLTGQEWFKDRENERPSWYEKDAKAWWKANREKFLEEHRKAKGE